MEVRTASRLAWTVAATTLAVYGGAIALAAMGRGHGNDVLFPIIGIFVVVGYATVGVLIASRHPDNAIGWLFLLISFGFSVTGFVEDYAARALASPGSLPGVEWAAWLGAWMPIMFVAPIPVVLLLFPTGRMPSRRWRPVLVAVVAGPILGMVGNALRPTHGQFTNPLGIDGAEPLARVLMGIGAVLTLVGSLASVAALIVRFRRSSGEERQQIRLLAFVGSGAALLLVGTFATFGRVSEWLFIGFFLAVGFGVPIASAVAILRYRLYALDLVLKRTVVFGILAAFITLAYFVLVVGIPTVVFGAGGGTENLIPFIAAAVLAIAFQPVRRAAQRFADRLVYGRRKSPYEVLAEFSERMVGAWSADEVLPTMAEIVRNGVGAERAEVWVRVGRELRRMATAPANQGPGPTLELSGDGLPAIPHGHLAAPVIDRGELIGALSVLAPRSAPLTPSQEQLVRDLAGQAALVLRNVRLIEDLRASRERLVAAQDEERRRIERNIHDGAQQQLVALSVNLKLARTLASKNPERAGKLLERLQADTQTALEDLRDLARGIYPPLLADKGLAAALEAQARKSATPVEVESNGIGRFSREAEVAVYFCVLEALQNAGKYARASRMSVHLRGSDGHVVFEVEDDGRGFDPERTARGTGLQNMADRLEALGGRLEIRSAPGRGTRVIGRVPLREREDVR